MEARDLLPVVLQPTPELNVTDYILDQENRRRALKLDFVVGSRFAVPGSDL